ncbi:protein dpy-30 homolog [Cylas formicarius]|uniref:protein dpy-30 homolog n=1 Tax=Cylas formicarius TaxID=197179 RepID=UPI00295870E7|nr:protein dpy-30 homolog [Cylas formicarius]
MESNGEVPKGPNHASNGQIVKNDHETILDVKEIAAEVCNLAGNPTYCKIVKAALRMENQESARKKSQIDLSVLPTREYLDQTVVPILLSGLCYLAQERPPEPVMALAEFLIKNIEKYNPN